jgi:hypothetical protein
MESKMTVTLEEFIKDFTPKERAKVAARTAELIAEITGKDPLKPRQRGRRAKEQAQDGG